MYKARYEGKHGKPQAQSVSARPRRRGRATAMLLATVMLFALAVGGTIAWLTDKDRPLVNTFDPSKVTCEVQEKFDGKVKSDVNVKNTGDIDAFIRVKLVTYRTNDAGQHIGGTAALPQFTLGANWVEYNGYYHYTLPVAPGDKPATKLTDSMTLTENYDDADGGHQSIDVMAEAIQSVPEAAVKAAWGTGFSIGTDGSLIVPAN